MWEKVALPDGKLLIPGVVSHATYIVEHPQVVADRIVRYAKVVGRENVIAGTDCGFGGRIHPQIAWAKLATLADRCKARDRRAVEITEQLLARVYLIARAIAL